MNKENLAAQLYQAAYITGDFLLRSGQRSHEYFDKYRFEAKPNLLRDIAKLMVPMIPKDVEVLAGLEMGGIPVATALSLESGIPVCFVRKEAKKYGTAKLAEGAEISGKRVLIIEDVITTGGQVILSAKDLREAGAVISQVLAVLDREQNGTEKLAAEGLQLRAAFTMAEIKEANLRVS
jgi:orotate phosphoribosyltransferase